MNHPSDNRALRALFKLMQEFNITHLEDGDVKIVRPAASTPDPHPQHVKPLSPLDQLLALNNE